MYVASQEGRPISVEEIKGIKNRFRIKEKVRLKEHMGRNKDRYIRGTVIHKTNYFITVLVRKNGIKRYMESFKYVDFILGEIEKVV